MTPQAAPRIGQISYTNCVPFYFQLDGYPFTKAVPAEINRAMHAGTLDIAPVSSMEYLNHSEEYYLLPQFSIGARNFSGSVILFTKNKIETLDGLQIAVTKESLSSVTLLEILLKFKYKYTNTFVTADSDPETMLKSYPAALVIGDDALFYHPEEFIYKYDLAELWWDWTQKPFCFALWAVRRSYADAFPEEVEKFCLKLKKNLSENLQDLQKLIERAMCLSFLDVKFSKIFGYLFNLNYSLDAETQEGLELFYRLANQLKETPKPEKLHFFEPVRG